MKYLLVSSLAMFGIFACTSGSRPKSPTDSSVEKSIADDDSTGCNFPAKDVMPGINIYQNPETTGDKVDPKLADQNFQQLKPMYNFILAVGRAVEGIPTWKGVPVIDKECVRSTFESWAEKSALLTRPPLSGGLVNRVMYTVALNVAALKARKAGVTFSANVEKWLFTLTSAVMQDYGLKGYHHHGFHNNVNAWSGAAAATFLAYTESPKNANYQVMMKEEQELFLETLRGINQKNPYKGLIPSELKRGQNAFAYSLFYMSALSMQLRARRAIGYSPTEYVKGQFDSFITAFGNNFCGSEEFILNQAMPSLREDEKPAVKEEIRQHLGSQAFRVLIGLDIFKSSDPRLSCINFNEHTVESRYGGEMKTTLMLFGEPASLD